MKIRKQIYDLTLADLRQFPIWEFCLDEEGEEDQDECTVRPHSAGEYDFEGMFICHAFFSLADGQKMEGFVTPAEDLSESQPTIYASDSQRASFWFGAMKPQDDEIEKMYAALGGRDAGIFPISWEVTGLPKHIPSKGTIDGFYYLEDFEKRIRIT